MSEKEGRSFDFDEDAFPVEWTACKAPTSGDLSLPYATHEGVLRVNGLPRMRLFMLNTGCGARSSLALPRRFNL